MIGTRLVELIWLMLPCYGANMAPPFVRYWRGWNRPINAERLGSHKTVVGFALGVVVAVAIAFVQTRVAAGPSAGYWLTVGLAQGFGAMGGDALKSYLKRRVGIAPGERWMPADQLDFIIGALLLMAAIVSLAWGDVLLLLTFTFLAHIAVNHIAYALRIRDTAW